MVDCSSSPDRYCVGAQDSVGTAHKVACQPACVVLAIAYSSESTHKHNEALREASVLEVHRLGLDSHLKLAARHDVLD